MDTIEYITRQEHQEFARRMDSENQQLGSRISELEATVKEISRLTTSVEKMAVSMENMAVEQKKQGERLDKIEDKPAKHWEAVVTGIIAAIVGALGTAIATGIIH